MTGGGRTIGDARKREAVAVPGADVEALAEDLREPLRGAVCACGHPADWHSGLIGCNAEDYDRPACACAEDWAGAVAPTVAAYVAQHRAEAEREREAIRDERNHWIGEAQRYERLYHLRSKDAHRWFDHKKAAERKLAKVEALADEYDERSLDNHYPWGVAADDLRAALRDEGGDQ